MRGRLKEIAVGDLVVVHAFGRARGNTLGRHRYLATVTRVTATQVAIDDAHRTRFMRSTGNEYGGDFYDGKWIEPATPKLAEQVRAEHRHTDAKAAVMQLATAIDGLRSRVDATAALERLEQRLRDALHELEAATSSTNKA